MTCCSCGEHAPDNTSALVTSPTKETFEFCAKCTKAMVDFLESEGAEKEMVDNVPF